MQVPLPSTGDSFHRFLRSTQTIWVVSCSSNLCLQPIWGQFSSFQILGSQRKICYLPASAPYLLLTNMESGQVLIFLLFSDDTHQSFYITGGSISNKNKGWKLQSPLEKLTVCICEVREVIKSTPSYKHSNRVIRKVNTLRMWLSREEMKCPLVSSELGGSARGSTTLWWAWSSNAAHGWDEKNIKYQNKGTLPNRASAAGSHMNEF